MSSPRVTTVLLLPAQGEKHWQRWCRPTAREMFLEAGRHDKTGENSTPTNGEDSTPAHTDVSRLGETVPCSNAQARRNGIHGQSPGAQGRRRRGGDRSGGREA